MIKGTSQLSVFSIAVAAAIQRNGIASLQVQSTQDMASAANDGQALPIVASAGQSCAGSRP